WRSARHTGFARGDANLFHDRATFDRVLDHLRADERRLLRRRLCFRFHSRARSPHKHLRVSADTARTTLRRESRTRDLAFTNDLFFATVLCAMSEPDMRCT